MNRCKIALEMLLHRGDTQTSIAKKIGVSQPIVGRWLRNESRIHPKHALSLAKLTNYAVTPHHLRPDIYPNQCDGLPD